MSQIVNRSRNPRNPMEWQEAVNVAAFLRGIYDCMLYGLLQTDMKINAIRCDEILEQGRLRGFSPLPMGELLKRYIGTAAK